jgi:DNA-binding response OmpR family regulator
MTEKQSLVLIVEDDHDARELLLEWFDLWKIKADAVVDAESALIQLQLNNYHALVIDLGLPGLDGISLIQSIRTSHTSHANVPCIAITAFDNTSVRHHSLQAGFDAYLAKPLNEKKLHEAVKRVLR